MLIVHKPQPAVLVPPITIARTRQRSATVCKSGLFSGLFGSDAARKQKAEQTPGQQQQQAAPTPVAANKVGTVSEPEFPPYRVLQKGNAYDLRFYDVYPVVEMDYQRREEGYLTLGNYQDGANSSSSRFGHTQPVTMSYHPNGRKVMQMMVGSRRDAGQQQQTAAGSSLTDMIAALPTPSDPAVRLAAAGGEIIAVMPFEGYITPDTAASIRKQLVAALHADGVSLSAEEAEGFFRVAQYGQVYTLQARLNEMMLRVQL